MISSTLNPAFLILCFSFFLLNACAQSTHTENMNDNTHKYTNQLINETSPYLLQHAHNPVNWYAWGEEALEKAKREDKLILVSVGYSACHWCHVMEHESFEDEEIAKYMNENFVCIKVDREERPDIDQVYMEAVQLLTQHGGWPLNCFALPDGKPFFGGTYFPKTKWLDVLQKVNSEYTHNRQKVEEFATRLTDGIAANDLIDLNTQTPFFNADMLDLTVDKWKELFDTDDGGANRAPKFPLPNNYIFLLRYAVLTGDVPTLKQVETTLDKMAYGGIYDQIGGGFARYSTDIRWKVPHFEKMLYDNGQLVSLYAEAYQYFKKPLYRHIVEQTLAFVERELTTNDGVFYSALDADSEGEEGKFYVWKEEELRHVLGKDYALIQDYYNVGGKGEWEHENNILLRDKSDEKIAERNNISIEELHEKVTRANTALLKERANRIRPGLDDKSLTSWNALMCKGYTDAYQALGNEDYLKAALKSATFLTQTQRKEDGGLWHSYKKGTSKINGYLEDYSFTIEALIGLYEVTFDEKWLTEAKRLADYVHQHFNSPTNGMYFFTSDLDDPLVARKAEINDNVIPASNSSIAKGFYYLGHYYDNDEYLDRAETMLNNIQNYMPKYGSGYSNWAILMLHYTYPFYEIAIAGDNADQKRETLQTQYIPNKLFMGCTAESDLPLLENKYIKGETLIYVCLNKTCQLPVNKVEEALLQLK